MSRTGIRFVLSNCTDPAHLDDYNEWYDTYAADCTLPGLLVNAIRFERPDASGTDDDPRFLALYDIVTPDPGTAWPDTAKHPVRLHADTFNPYAATAFRSTYALDGVDGRGATDRTGVAIVLTDVTDDVPVRDFATRILETGLYNSAARFRIVEGSPDPPARLLVLETAESDPLAAYPRALEASGATMPPQRYAGAFRLLSSYPA
jgi:hypothetical protein